MVLGPAVRSPMVVRLVVARPVRVASVWPVMWSATSPALRPAAVSSAVVVGVATWPVVRSVSVVSPWGWRG
jgi:hypothetical protein